MAQALKKAEATLKDGKHKGWKKADVAGVIRLITAGSIDAATGNSVEFYARDEQGRQVYGATHGFAPWSLEEFEALGWQSYGLKTIPEDRVRAMLTGSYKKTPVITLEQLRNPETTPPKKYITYAATEEMNIPPARELYTLEQLSTEDTLLIRSGGFQPREAILKHLKAKGITRVYNWHRIEETKEQNPQGRFVHACSDDYIVGGDGIDDDGRFVLVAPEAQEASSQSRLALNSAELADFLKEQNPLLDRAALEQQIKAYSQKIGGR
ncbi:MAG: hypothetical protein V1659_05875 [Candidatus Woesearchaeota archaeon]